MQVDGHINGLGNDELRHAVGHLLGQRAVRLAGIAAVDVAALAAGQLLTHVVDVDIRVRPLVDGIGGAGTVAELTHGAGIQGDANGVGMRLLGVVVGSGAVVGAGDDVNGTGLDLRVLDKEHGSHVAAHLIGMRAAEDKHRAAFLLAFHYIDFGIAGSTFQTRKVLAEHTNLGNPRAGNDDIFLPGGHKGLTRNKATGGDHNQHDYGHNLILFHDSPPFT